jgi:hypothetical protein
MVDLISKIAVEGLSHPDAGSLLHAYRQLSNSCRRPSSSRSSRPGSIVVRAGPPQAG